MWILIMARRYVSCFAAGLIGLGIIAGGGCTCGARDITYSPYRENRGHPTLGKQAEALIPDGFMERLDCLDSRIENTVY
jgi:hypothetical protein